MIKLPGDDQKAWDWIEKNFSICAHEHILSRKLWDRFATFRGNVYAIKPNCVELDKLQTYMEIWWSPGDTPKLVDDPVEEWPITQMVQFGYDYLKSKTKNVIVVENFNATRKMYDHWEWGKLPPYSCYGEKEVYHIVTQFEIGSKTLRDSIRQSFVSWGVAVCSICEKIPEGSIMDETFFDEIVDDTSHIFLPAFDGDGFLVWSPKPMSDT